MVYASQITRVQPAIRIKRERLLPRLGEVTVRRGEELQAVQVVARTSLAVKYTIVPVAAELGLSAADTYSHLLVREGDDVRESMPLASKSGFLGRKRVVRSPISGTVVQEDNGRLVIRRQSVLLELRAMMGGRVVEIIPERGIILETIGAQIECVWDSGKEAFGRIRCLTDEPTQELESAAIASDMRGTLLVAGTIQSHDTLRVAENSGVRGIIVGGLDVGLLEPAKELSLPIFVTDGIGSPQMATPIYDLLRQLENRDASLMSHETATIGSRAEIIVPLPASSAPDAQDESDLLLAPGQVVRVLRAPCLGQVGTIKFVYSRGRRTATGNRVYGADVTLTNGDTVFVPQTNLDLLVKYQERKDG